MMEGMNKNFMVILYLSDILLRAGIEPKEVMLIRHSINNEQSKNCYEIGMVYE